LAPPPEEDAPLLTDPTAGAVGVVPREPLGTAALPCAPAALAPAELVTPTPVCVFDRVLPPMLPAVVGRELGAQCFEGAGVAVAGGGVAVHGVWVALFCGVVCDAA